MRRRGQILERRNLERPIFRNFKIATIKITKDGLFDVLFSKGGGQNLERRNVERPIFWNFEIANIKIKKDELFDNFIFELFFHFLETIGTPEIFNDFWYCKILIFQMVKLKKFLNFPNC